MSTNAPDSIAGSIRPDASGATTSSNTRSNHTPKLAGLIASRVYGAGARTPASRRSGVDVTDLSSAAMAAEHPRRPAENGALPFYTNPARSNEVATEIAIGRSLDVKG